MRYYFWKDQMLRVQTVDLYTPVQKQGGNLKKVQIQAKALLKHIILKIICEGEMILFHDALMLVLSMVEVIAPINYRSIKWPMAIFAYIIFVIVYAVISKNRIENICVKELLHHINRGYPK